MKMKTLMVRLTEEQMKILEAKTRMAGYNHKSEYIRSVLFMSIPMIDKINKIYDVVVKNAR